MKTTIAPLVLVLSFGLGAVYLNICAFHAFEVRLQKEAQRMFNAGYLACQKERE